MAAKRQNTHHYRNEYGTEYIEGNTVRKAAPERQYERIAPKKQRRPVSAAVRRNRAKALYMDAPYVVALTIAAVCTLFLCINYIQLQSSITAKVKNIAKVRTGNVKTLKAENDALEYQNVKTSVNLDYVYKSCNRKVRHGLCNKKIQVRLYSTKRKASM